MKKEKVIKPADEGKEKTGGEMTENDMNNIREEVLENLQQELIMLDIYPCDFDVRKELAGCEMTTDCDGKTIYQKLQKRIYIWRLRNEIADLKEELAAIKKRGQKD